MTRCPKLAEFQQVLGIVLWRWNVDRTEMHLQKHLFPLTGDGSSEGDVDGPGGAHIEEVDSMVNMIRIHAYTFLCNESYTVFITKKQGVFGKRGKPTGRSFVRSIFWDWHHSLFTGFSR